MSTAVSKATVDLGPVTVVLGEKNGKYPDGNQVIVRGADTKVAFDTPLSSARLTETLDGTDLVILGHAHEDHACGLGLLPETPVLAPEQDLAAIQSPEGMLAHYGYSEAVSAKMRSYIVEAFHYHPRPDATGYSHGATWELGGGVSVRAVHTPGHTRGHTALVVEPGGIAFIGDIDLSGFGPYYGDACSDLPAFIRTLEEIEHLEARVWITYHHKGVITERETFLELLRAFREKITRREQAILAEIADGGRTLEQLVAHRFMYPRSYENLFANDAERHCTRQHLDLLLDSGRIVAEEGGAYRAVG